MCGKCSECWMCYATSFYITLLYLIIHFIAFIANHVGCNPTTSNGGRAIQFLYMLKYGNLLHLYTHYLIHIPCVTEESWSHNSHSFEARPNSKLLYLLEFSTTRVAAVQEWEALGIGSPCLMVHHLHLGVNQTPGNKWVQVKRERNVAVLPSLPSLEREEDLAEVFESYCPPTREWQLRVHDVKEPVAFKIGRG